jgi:polyribonucleotide 5'-hydroxyl-kinase
MGKLDPYVTHAILLNMLLGLVTFFVVILMQLQGGTAEVFGAELQLGDRLNIKGQALAVFTWEGCKILVEGEPDVM